jgi:hypothetical protein
MNETVKEWLRKAERSVESSLASEIVKIAADR